QDRREDDSYYVVRMSDERYMDAFAKGWWPHIDPADYVGGGTDFITPLYTEYWFNDWSSGATIGGEPVPQISGGLINKIPFPQYTVVMCDAKWQLPRLRHGGAMQFMFLDCHVEKIPRLKFLDPRGHESGYTPQDLDPYGNRPFYAWGLTREGIDGALE
ncbi:MAG: hypothetical protein MI702_06640, partial [Chlorobiales bacterium]|nr:hypothetical protein [Chlorobiales bacterium]